MGHEQNFIKKVNRTGQLEARDKARQRVIMLYIFEETLDV